MDYADRERELQRGNFRAITCDAIDCEEPGHAAVNVVGSPSAIIHIAECEMGWTVPKLEALEALSAIPPEAIPAPPPDDVIGLLPPNVQYRGSTAVSTRFFVLCQRHHPTPGVAYGTVLTATEPGNEDALLVAE